MQEVANGDVGDVATEDVKYLPGGDQGLTCNGEIVSVADSEGCDHQKPDAVDEGHLARRPRVLVAVEGVAHVVLHQEHQPRPLQQETCDPG